MVFWFLVLRVELSISTMLGTQHPHLRPKVGVGREEGQWPQRAMLGEASALPQLCPGCLGKCQVTASLVLLCSWGFTVVHETEKHEKQQW